MKSKVEKNTGEEIEEKKSGNSEKLVSVLAHGQLPGREAARCSPPTDRLLI